jgi:MFS transporter, FHS family, glucose/mannose:H+ symporter
MIYRRKAVFAAACMGMLLFGIVMISIGAILPSITARYQLDGTGTGSLVSLLPLGILIGSIVFGPIVDRYGYRQLLIACAILILLGLQGIAHAPSIWWLSLSVLLIGFAGGAINGGVNALVSDISAESKGANLSLLGMFFGLGALGMPGLLSILSKSLGYSTILSGVGFAIVFPIAYFSMIRFPEPKQAQGFPLRESLRLLTNPIILLIGFFLFFQSGVEGLASTWTTSFLEGGIGTSARHALLGLTAFEIGMTGTRFLLGSLLRRFSMAGTLGFTLMIALVASLVLSMSSNYYVLLAGLLLLGVGFSAGFPVMLAYTGELFSALSGTAFSIVLVIGLLGNVLLNYLMGFLTDAVGLHTMPWLLVISISCLALLLALVYNRIKKQIKIH